MIFFCLSFELDIVIHLIRQNGKRARRNPIGHASACRAGKVPEGAIFSALALDKWAEHYSHLLPTAPILPRAEEGDKWSGEKEGGEQMIVLSAPGELSPNTKELLRKEVKEKLGEDCVILDCGIQITQISVKKDSATGGDQ